MTKTEQAERENVKRFMDAIETESSFTFNIGRFGELHYESFQHPAAGIEQLFVQDALRGYASGKMLEMQTVIMNGMFMGFLLGREYQKRMRDGNSLERMLGIEEPCEKPKAKRAVKKRK